MKNLSTIVLLVISVGLVRGLRAEAPADTIKHRYPVGDDSGDCRSACGGRGYLGDEGRQSNSSCGSWLLGPRKANFNEHGWIDPEQNLVAVFMVQNVLVNGSMNIRNAFHAKITGESPQSGRNDETSAASGTH